eukprot:2240797-Prymnesium_polylepis.1
MGIWMVFNDTNADWVIAADAETVVQPEIRAPGEYLRAWQQQKTLIFSNTSGVRFGGGKRQQMNQDMGCDAMGLPRIFGCSWFSDAPIYSRSDFADFLDILRRRRDFPDKSKSLGVPWDHVMYTCYKVHVQGWTQIFVDIPSEDLDCVVHEKYAPGHNFTWARGICPIKTMLEFHLDREGKRSHANDYAITRDHLPTVPSTIKNPQCFTGWEDRQNNVWAQIGSPEYGDGRFSHRNNITVPSKGGAIPFREDKKHSQEHTSHSKGTAHTATAPKHVKGR